MKINFKYKTPGELPLRKFLEFKEIVNDDSLQDFAKEISTLSILCDLPEDEIYKLTFPEVQPLFNKMHENISKFNTNKNIFSHKPKKLILNGNEYKVNYKLSKINVAQYVDFQIVAAKSTDLMDNIIDILSIFVTPKDHKYGEDYDMDKVRDDLGSLDTNTALAITFFLKRRSVNLIKNRLSYARMMMRMSSWVIKDPEVKKQIKELIKMMKETEKELK